MFVWTRSLRKYMCSDLTFRTIFELWAVDSQMMRRVEINQSTKGLRGGRR